MGAWEGTNSVRIGEGFCEWYHESIFLGSVWGRRYVVLICKKRGQGKFAATKRKAEDDRVVERVNGR